MPRLVRAISKTTTDYINRISLPDQCFSNARNATDDYGIEVTSSMERSEPAATSDHTPGPTSIRYPLRSRGQLFSRQLLLPSDGVFEASGYRILSVFH